ncbi:hypothetical protein [Pseudorhodoferax soli]|uniref:Heme oxygenase-like protein n=1 Tax=Pseudorhodoferax soli TaxID=545864 RepID=A0A368XKS4_9BURK|nr:hypothetical protein [Pseudorhodoferax soli]RCW68510.1 hypothetical protein DES41_10731 [Pseudorhodoferax soli]
MNSECASTDDYFFSPRAAARRILIDQLGQETATRNRNFAAGFIRRIKSQRIFTHPILDALRDGAFDRDTLAEIHLEFRNAVVTVFTDAILAAQLQSRTLESRFGPASHMVVRFLLSLNLLDEFGYKPGIGEESYFRGHPWAAHFCMFDEVLSELGVDADARAAYSESDGARRVRLFIESQFSDYLGLLVVLASTEETAMVICPAMRKAAAHVGIDVTRGYYFVHGTTADAETRAFDDDHQEDVAFALMHAMTPTDDRRACRLADDYGQVWLQFWDDLWTRVEHRRIRPLEA